MCKSIKPLFYVAMVVVTMASLSCKKVESVKQPESASFFDKSIIVAGNQLSHSATSFVNPVSKEIDEGYIDKTIEELKKLESRDHFVTRMKRSAGQPVWNESLVFTGGDGVKTIITPMYNEQMKVNGALFGFFEKNGNFNTQILSSNFALKHLKDSSQNIRIVSRSTITGLLDYFKTRKSVNKPVLQSNLNTTGTLDNPTNIVYTVCWYVPILVYAPSTVVFQQQCHTEVFYGTYSEWDYYYNNGADFIDQNEGYYETYDENTIEKGIENVWEREHVDTLGIITNPCLLNVVRRIMNNPTTDWGHLMGKLFAGTWGAQNPSAYDIHVNFEVKPNIPNKNANTVSDQSGVSTIQINASVFNNCTDLFAASVLIHEFTHAYLSQMLIAHNVTNDTAILNDFQGCFQAYQQWVYDETSYIAWSPTVTQHEYMAGYMIELMAKALQEFDNDSQNGLEYYWKLCWGSLQDTPTWQYYSTHPMTSESQKNGILFTWSYALTADRISSILSILLKEQDNTTGAVGQPHDFSNCY